MKHGLAAKPGAFAPETFRQYLYERFTGSLADILANPTVSFVSRNFG